MDRPGLAVRCAGHDRRCVGMSVALVWGRYYGQSLLFLIYRLFKRAALQGDIRWKSSRGFESEICRVWMPGTVTM